MNKQEVITILRNCASDFVNKWDSSEEMDNGIAEYADKIMHEYAAQSHTADVTDTRLVPRVEADAYQGLFNLLSRDHGLTLTITEMDEIVMESEKLVGKFNDAIQPTFKIDETTIKKGYDDFEYTEDWQKCFDNDDTEKEFWKQGAKWALSRMPDDVPKNENEFLHYCLVNLLRLGEPAMRHIFESLAARLPDGGWVKVKDGTPNITKYHVEYCTSDDVLVIGDDFKGIEIAKYQKGTNSDGAYTEWYSERFDDSITVTHWRELPKSPTT